MAEEEAAAIAEFERKEQGEKYDLELAKLHRYWESAEGEAERARRKQEMDAAKQVGQKEEAAKKVELEKEDKINEAAAKARAGARKRQRL